VCVWSSGNIWAMCIYYILLMKFLLYKILAPKVYLCVCFSVLMAWSFQEKYDPTLRKAMEQNGSDIQKYQYYFLWTCLQPRRVWLPCWTALGCLTLKKIALRFFETSGRTCLTTQHHVTEDVHLQYRAVRTCVLQFTVNAALPVLAVGIHTPTSFRCCGLLVSICIVSFLECNW